MKTSRIAPLAVAASLALAVALPGHAAPGATATQAASSADAPHGMRHGQQGHRGDHAMGQRHGDKAGSRHAMGELDLTDAQKDQIFALRHAAMPALRDAMKTARASQQALRELAHSGQFDQTKAETLANQAATARAQASLTRAKLQADIVALLTPEQRAKAEALHAQRGERGHGHGPRGGLGMMP